MQLLRNVLKDLVDKRLWPVAVLLVGALVAVPLVLSRAGDAGTTDVTTPVAGVAGNGGTSSKASVTLDTTPDEIRHDDGKLRDPFAAPKVRVKKTVRASTTAAAPATTGTSASASTGATGGSSTGATGSSTGSSDSSSSTSGSTGTGTTKPKSTKTTTTTKTTTGVAEDSTDTYHVSVRFGVDGAKLKTVRDVARLSPVPSVDDPFFVYLGVLETATSKEQRAVFIVTSSAEPNGEGACHPTRTDCETVELAVGETAYFDVTDASGKVTQYQLQLAGIHKTEIKSEAKASAAIARHSVAGAELLRDAAARKVRFAAGARAYRYLPASGLLVRAKRKHVTARAAAAGMVPGLELVDRDRQPGLAVWHSPKK